MSKSTYRFRNTLQLAKEVALVCLLSFVVIPMATATLLIAAASGWSASGATNGLVQLLVDVQRVGPAAQDGKLRLVVCQDAPQPLSEVPVYSACHLHEVIDAPVSQVAAGALGVLQRLYIMSVLFSTLLVLGYRALRAPATDLSSPEQNFSA